MSEIEHLYMYLLLRYIWRTWRVSQICTLDSFHPQRQSRSTDCPGRTWTYSSSEIIQRHNKSSNQNNTVINKSCSWKIEDYTILNNSCFEMLTCLMLDGRPRPKLILNLKLSSFPTYVENKNKEILLFSGHSYSNHFINPYIT